MPFEVKTVDGLVVDGFHTRVNNLVLVGLPRLAWNGPVVLALVVVHVLHYGSPSGVGTRLELEGPVEGPVD